MAFIVTVCFEFTCQGSCRELLEVVGLPKMLMKKGSHGEYMRSDGSVTERSHEGSV